MSGASFNSRLSAGPANGPPAAAPLIQVERLTVRYGSKTALEDVSLDILPNGILALVGPSGCGKTSFLNCLNRLTDLIPNCKVSGRICIGDARSARSANRCAFSSPAGRHDLSETESVPVLNPA